jgi:metal-responsive CopG/Arc/MetJ family transcriptional regulator
VPTVKTAISMPKSLFDQVDDLAKELQVPRSQVFALAVEELIRKHENRRILAALNEVYEHASGPDDDALHRAMQRQQKRVVHGEW